MSTWLLGRSTAKAYGWKRYSTGHPCRAGHEAERYTATAECVECVRLRTQRQRISGTRQRIDARYDARHPERLVKQQRFWEASHAIRKAAKEAGMTVKAYQRSMTQQQVAAMGVIGP